MESEKDSIENAGLLLSQCDGFCSYNLYIMKCIIYIHCFCYILKKESVTQLRIAIHMVTNFCKCINVVHLSVTKMFNIPPDLGL